VSGREFDHVVITRFSAVLGHDAGPADEEWLSYRLGFFVDACLPALRAQTVTDFRWLVWFDDRCSVAFRAEVERWAQGSFEPVWTHESFWTSMPQTLAESTSAPWLITTWYDSDDAVAIDFIEAVQREFSSQWLMFVDFPRGLQVDRDGAVYSYVQPSNHFASLIERRTDPLPLTVFVERGHRHRHMRRVAPVRQVASAPMWLEIIHGLNVVNDVRGPRVAPDDLNARFSLTLDYRRAVPRRTLHRERLTSLGKVASSWRRIPIRAVEWGQGVRHRHTGTATLPHEDGPTLEDRLRRLKGVWRGHR
jgi:hypothetical protein